MVDSRLPKLLVLASTYPRWAGDHEPGFVHELNRRLVDSFEVTALVPHAPGADLDEVVDGVQVLRYKYAPSRWETLVVGGGIVSNLRRSRWKWLLVPGFIGAQWFAVRRLLRQRHFDAIHAHWLIPQGMVAALAADENVPPCLVTSHGGDLYGLRGRMLRKLKRWVARRSAAMTVVSSAMVELAQRQRISAPMIQVIPMGVDMKERFVPASSREPEEDRLLFVGRLVEKKGLRHLINALPRVLAKRPDACLEIVGYGPEESVLRDLVERLGLREKVHFLGPKPQDSLPALYQSASLFIAPFIQAGHGDQEGLPVVLMEAVGCGCPILVGDVPGLEDLLGEDKDAVCVDVADPDALASAIVERLDNAEIARGIALQIRTRAEERIDWSRIASRYATILRGLVSNTFSGM